MTPTRRRSKEKILEDDFDVVLLQLYFDSYVIIIPDTQFRKRREANGMNHSTWYSSTGIVYSDYNKVTLSRLTAICIGGRTDVDGSAGSSFAMMISHGQKCSSTGS